MSFISINGENITVNFANGKSVSVKDSAKNFILKIFDVEIASAEEPKTWDKDVTEDQVKPYLEKLKDIRTSVLLFGTDEKVKESLVQYTSDEYTEYLVRLALLGSYDVDVNELKVA